MKSNNKLDVKLNGKKKVQRQEKTTDAATMDTR